MINSGSACMLSSLRPMLLFLQTLLMQSRSKEVIGIGTLLGTVSGGGSRVEVTNSYAVPHEEQAGSVSLDVDFHRTMLQLHQKVHPNEGVVGWYSTGLGVKVGDVLLGIGGAGDLPASEAGIFEVLRALPEEQEVELVVGRPHCKS